LNNTPSISKEISSPSCSFEAIENCFEPKRYIFCFRSSDFAVNGEKCSCGLQLYITAPSIPSSSNWVPFLKNSQFLIP